MPPTSSAMELKVLINILQSGAGLKSILDQVNQVSSALTQLQAKANAAGAAVGAAQPAAAGGGTGAGAANANAAAQAANNLANSAAAAKTGMTGMGNAGQAAVPGLKAFEGAVAQVWTGVKFLAGGFLALQSIQFLKSLADTAARTEVLGTVLHVVARNAGVTTDEIDKVSKGVQKLGITAQAANQSLAQFLQAGLDVKFAEPLARAAQDLAVISGMDSSQTFSRLLLNIQQLDTMGLRWMGIVVSMSDATQKYADQHKKAADALSQTEKQQALLNAVIEKARGLEGAYEAAMGNVGKQLTSLTRYTTELKSELGEQLLPAYSAVISELSLFLAKANDLAIANNANKDAANALAEALRWVAHWLGEIALLLMEHKTLVMIVAGAWGLWKLAIVVVLPLLAFLFDMLSAGGALLYVAGEAAIGFIAALTGLGTVASGGLLLVVIGLVAGLGYLVKQLFFASDATDKLYDATKKLATARDEEERAKIAATQASITGTLKEEEAAKKAYDAAKKAREEAEKARDAELEALEKSDPERAKKEKEFAARQKELVAFNKLMTEAGNARDKLKTTVSGLEILPKDFAEKLQQLKTLGDTYEAIKKKAAEADPTLKKTADDLAEEARQRQQGLIEQVEGARELAGMTSSSVALGKQQAQSAAIRAQINANTDLSAADKAKQLKRLDEADTKARLTAAAGERAYTQEQRSIFETRIRERQNREKQAMELQLDLLKGHNQALQKEEDFKYQRGELSAQAYFDAKSKRIAQEYAVELDLAVQARDAILEQQRKGIGTATDQERQQLQSRLAAAEATITKLQGTATTPGALDQRQAELRLQQTGASRDLEQDIKEIRLENAAAFGTEAQQAAVIEEKYAQKLKSMKDAGNEQAKAVLDAQKEAELYALHVKFLDTKLQLELEGSRAKKRELDLAQAMLNVEKQRVDVAEDMGLITTTEAMRIRNAQVLKQLEIDTAKLKQLQADQALKQVQYAEKYNAIIAQMQEKAKRENKVFDPNSPEVRARILADLGAAQTELDGMQTEIIELAGAVDTAFSKLQSYGLELRKVFVDGLSDMLTEIMMDFHNVGDELIKFGETLRRKILNTIAQDMAKRITKVIVDATSQKDPTTGKSVPGTSIFDSIFKMMGLGTDKPDGSVEAPFHVIQDNPQTTTQENVLPGTINKGAALQQGISGIGSQVAGVDISGVVAGLGNLFRSFGKTPASPAGGSGLMFAAEGGTVSGPGTGTSDSIPAMVSAGEHIMPAAKARMWMPLLEGIRLGRLQSIALGSVIPRHYAAGGVVVADGGASSVQTGGGGGGNMTLSLHPDALNMSMREWLEHEVVRQHGRR